MKLTTIGTINFILLKLKIFFSTLHKNKKITDKTIGNCIAMKDS